MNDDSKYDVPAEAVKMSPGAEAKIRDWLEHCANSSDPNCRIPSVTHGLGGALYDADGKLEKVYGPHVGLGGNREGHVHEDCLQDFLGHKVLLKLRPSEISELNSVFIDIKDGVLTAEFDPPWSEDPDEHSRRMQRFKEIEKNGW